MNEEINFIKTKHPYSGKGKGQIYLPVGLLSMKSRLEECFDGKKINFIDENIPNTKIDYSKLSGIIGIGIEGCPGIPKTLDIISKISKNVTILLGGQIVDSFTKDEFNRLFGSKHPKVFNGNQSTELEKVFKLKEGSIGKMEDVDMVKAYKDIPNKKMKEYLSREFSLYLSQGCLYNCSFCQAAKGTKEKYRNFDMLEKELRYLAKKAQQFKISSLNMYLSNLDLLQTPSKFEKFLDVIEKVKKETEIYFGFRALCGVQSFTNVYKKEKELLERAKKLGLSALGYGVDGVTAQVWESIGKKQNMTRKKTKFNDSFITKLYRQIISKMNFFSKSDILEEQKKVIETIKHTYELGITPETLMVFGHPGEEKKTLKLATKFCKDMYEKYGAIPRPHVAKSKLPGSRDSIKDKGLIDYLMAHPEEFQALDYTALASEITHPNEELRKNTNENFIAICKIKPEVSTKYIIPDTNYYRQEAKKKGITIEQQNEGKFDK